MEKIIDLFLELYEDNKLNVNWKSNNPSFRFTNEILPIQKLLNVINENDKEDEKSEENLVTEDELVNYIFFIINNILNVYYDKTTEADEMDQYIQSIIDKSIDDTLKEVIKYDIFIDNSIRGNRLNLVQTEIMTKRDENEVDKVGGYTSKITLEAINPYKEITQFEIEIKKTELENLIEKLEKINKDMDILFGR